MEVMEKTRHTNVFPEISNFTNLFILLGKEKDTANLIRHFNWMRARYHCSYTVFESTILSLIECNGTIILFRLLIMTAKQEACEIFEEMLDKTNYTNPQEHLVRKMLQVYTDLKQQRQVDYLNRKLRVYETKKAKT